MFQHIRDHKTSKSGNVAVYGLDSDLIMLSVFHCKLFDNLFIFRETPEFGKQIISGDHNDSQYLFLHIQSLYNCVDNGLSSSRVILHFEVSDSHLHLRHRDTLIIIVDIIPIWVLGKVYKVGCELLPIR